MEQQACGGGMSALLCREICAYQLCMLDDTVAEAVHRDLSWQAKHAISSTISWWASSVRLNQILALEASPLGSLIHEHWHKWTVLLNQSPNKRRVWQPLRILTSTFLARVYRTGTTGLTDWSGLQPFSEPDDARKRGTLCARMVHDVKVDLVHCILTKIMIVSIPNVSAERAQAVLREEGTALVADAGFLLEKAADEFMCFQPLDFQAKQKRHIRTYYWKRVCRMGFPASVQLLVLEHGRPDGTMPVTMFPCCCPEVADLLTVAPGPVVRTALRQLATVSSMCLPFALVMCN